MENKETQNYVQRQLEGMSEDYKEKVSNNPYGSNKPTVNTKSVFYREFESYLWSKNCSSEQPTPSDVKAIFENPSEMGAFTLHLIMKIEKLVFDKCLKTESIDNDDFNNWLDNYNSTPLVVHEKNIYEILEEKLAGSKES